MIALTDLTQEAAADDYLDLVRAFPLRAVRSNAEHARGLRILTRLLGRPDGPLSEGERDYAHVLGRLLDDFSQRGGRLPRRKMPPLEVLRFLMEQQDMSVAALGKVLGNKTAASLVLSGKRELSKSHIRRLASYFKVDAGLFI
jgi:HTH-type transcriptional regulator/antitoxin HigA